MTKVAPELLRRLLRYEAETGKLFWLPRTADMFTGGKQSADHICNRWNAAFAGREAFAATPGNPYCAADILGAPYLAHRVIWAMQTGAWPEACVDHIDGDCRNNAWSNLRAATFSQNSHNARLSKRNKSGVKGVSWHSASGKWLAAICVRRVTKHVGFFDDLTDATQAVLSARKELHGEFGRIA